MLHSTTTLPKKINDALRGSLPESLAAIGAANTPPMMRARITCQCCTPMSVKKVKALASVTKNSVRLTDPTTKRGVRPLVMSVADTIGPQPPPPNESKKPPAPASHPYRLNFFLTVVFFKCVDKDLYAKEQGICGHYRTYVTNVGFTKFH